VTRAWSALIGAVGIVGCVTTAPTKSVFVPPAGAPAVKGATTAETAGTDSAKTDGRPIGIPRDGERYAIAAKDCALSDVQRATDPGRHGVDAFRFRCLLDRETISLTLFDKAKAEGVVARRSVDVQTVYFGNRGFCDASDLDRLARFMAKVDCERHQQSARSCELYVLQARRDLEARSGNVPAH
jgi:hypothetical protein